MKKRPSIFVGQIRQSGELQSVSAISHKEKMKKENEQKSEKQEFGVGDLVLVDSSGVPCLPGKLKSKWIGPYLIIQVFPHGAVELKDKEGVRLRGIEIEENSILGIKHRGMK